MEEKIERLRNSVRSNPNLSDEFKANVGTLTDVLVTVFPEYDYSNLEGVLSQIQIVPDSQIEDYSFYDSLSNTLKINTDRIFEDRIDMQHLFLNNMLEANSKTSTGYESFKRGLTELVSSTINSDESMKKLNPQETVLMGAFSKIVDPRVLLESYMSGSLVEIIMYLDALGISKEEFDRLADSFTGLHKNEDKNTSFSDAEVQMIDMYSKKLDRRIESGEISQEDLQPLFDNFRDSLIFSRSELTSIYPYHDFSNLSGFERVKESLSKAVVNKEDEIIDVRTK